MKKKIINIVMILITLVVVSYTSIKVSAAITASNVTYNNGTVKEALDELIDIAVQCPDNALCSKAKIGDYVRMAPTKTSYSVSGLATGMYDKCITDTPTSTTCETESAQVINPSELNLWRIIAINKDGTIEMVSEYVSSNNVSFYGRTGYLNYVGTLNTIANQYQNENYTINARYMGYNGQSQIISDITDMIKTTAPYSVSTSDNSNEALGGGDVMYETDTELVTNALGTLIAYEATGTTARIYWLASRRYYYGSSVSFGWYVRGVAASGNMSGYYPYRYMRDSFKSYSNTSALRPIVTLKSDVQATGNGSSSSPWILQ